MTDSVNDKRVMFDFEIDFSNGGGIQGQQFRLTITRLKSRIDAYADSDSG